MRKRIGHRTLSWGIPLVLLIQLDFYPFTATLCCLSVRNSLTQFSTFPLISLVIFCGTLSKALQKSRYITSTSLSSSIASVMSSLNPKRLCYTRFSSSKIMLSICEQNVTDHMIYYSISDYFF